jgi:hypothetical protein
VSNEYQALHHLDRPISINHNIVSEAVTRQRQAHAIDRMPHISECYNRCTLIGRMVNPATFGEYRRQSVIGAVIVSKVLQTLRGLRSLPNRSKQSVPDMTSAGREGSTQLLLTDEYFLVTRTACPSWNRGGILRVGEATGQCLICPGQN